jgi:type VI protein secretion system component VasK
MSRTRIAATFATALMAMLGTAACGGGGEGEAQQAEQLGQRVEQLEQQVEQQQQQLDEQQKLLEQQVRETVEEEVQP